MTEIRLLHDVKLHDNNGAVVFDFAARELMVVRIVVDVGEHHVEIIEAVPAHADDWVVELLVDVAEIAVAHTIEALCG
jgi:hypothetical protein